MNLKLIQLFNRQNIPVFTLFVLVFGLFIFNIGFLSGKLENHELVIVVIVLVLSYALLALSWILRRKQLNKLLGQACLVMDRYNSGASDDISLHVDLNNPLAGKTLVFEILKDVGLPAVKIPRFVWQIYKRLPNHPFYKITHRECRLAKGKTNTTK